MSMDHQSKANRDTTQRPSISIMLEAGHDLTIYDGTFNQINGPFTQIKHDNQGSGIHMLSKMIATDAIHDACERYPPPNVHPGTRTKILEVLTAWINDPDSESQVFWLHGSAGVGKSAILQALAELLLLPKGPVVGSFFFGKGQGKRGSGDYLFSTLAYQLAVNVHGLRAYVDEAMQGNPTLPTKSMEIQLRTLIIEPFQRLQSLPSHIQTVIVDGLDECRGDETQKLILQLIGDALTKHKLPLRFLIASRPEPHICDGFDNSTLLPVTNRLMLHNDFRTQNDIRVEKYLQDGFADICRKSRSMIHVKMPWPGIDVINTLTGHACGQFIYVATVLKFVGQKSTYPPEQLDIILRPHPSRGKAFSDLDCLYSEILSTHPDPDTLVRVLSTILAFREPQPAVVIEDILEMEKGEILDVLQGLHSLLKVPGDDISQSLANSDSDDDNMSIRPSKPLIRIRHASFRDYLLDKNRSGTFYIDETTLDAHLSTSIFSITSNWILKSSHRGFTDGPSCAPDSETQSYIRYHLFYHLNRLHNCLGLNEVAAEFEQQAPKRIEDASSVPFEALYSVIQPLSDAISNPKEQEICEELSNVRKKYVTVLDVCYRSVLSLGNLDTVLANLPGFGVIKKHLAIDILGCIYQLDGQKISSILEERERFINRSSWQPERNAVRLSPWVVEFLTDKERAGVHYYDQIAAHFMVCHNTIPILFPPSWQDIPEPVLKGFYPSVAEEFFRYHLNAPYIDNMPEVQHTVSLLDHLDTIDYYDPKWPCLHDGDRVILIWQAIKEVLFWLVKRKHDLCNALAKRCTQLFDKILSQVLCLQPAETKSGLIHFVTILEPFRSFWSASFSDARNNFLSYRKMAPILGSNIPVWLSYDMVLLELHTVELEEYLTDAERAGSFYIDAYNYFDSLFHMCVQRFKDIDHQHPSAWKRDFVLVTTCLSYLVHARASKELYASLRPIPRWGSFQPTQGYTRILELLKASPHTPPDLYSAWEEQLERPFSPWGPSTPLLAFNSDESPVDEFWLDT